MLDYRPDFDPTTVGNLTGIQNMMPTEKGYKAWHYPTAQTSAQLTLQASESPISCLYATRWLSTPGGIVIAGTNKDLYVYDYTNGFIKVSKSGGYTLTGSTYQYGEDAAAAFDMCSFGDILIAAHKSVVPQYRSALDLTISTLFADLGTTSTAPKASVCETASNFVFLGDLASTWGTVISTAGTRDMVAWSAIGDHQNWNNDPTGNQSSFQQFVDVPGPITALKRLGDNLVVFKANAMYIGRYVGAGYNSPIWAFERISDRIGCIGHRSVVDIGGQLVFVGPEDAYIFDGTRPRSITRGIWETEFKGMTNYDGTFPMRAGHDPVNGCVRFTRANVSGQWLVWSYRHDKWSIFANYGEGDLTGTNGAGADPICFCKANTGDLRKITTSAYSGTVSSDHTEVYTMFATSVAASGGNPTKAQVFNHFNTNTAWSVTGAYLWTWAIGDDERVTKITRLVPKWATVPTSATARSDHKDILGATSWTSGTAISMDSRYRFDMTTYGTASANWQRFLISITGHSGAEIIDISPTIENSKPVGKK